MGPLLLGHLMRNRTEVARHRLYQRPELVVDDQDPSLMMSVPVRFVGCIYDTSYITSESACGGHGELAEHHIIS
jgi:hypothetical protein